MIWWAIAAAGLVIKWTLMATGFVVWAIALMCAAAKPDPNRAGWETRNPEWDK